MPRSNRRRAPTPTSGDTPQRSVGCVALENRLIPSLVRVYSLPSAIARRMKSPNSGTVKAMILCSGL